MKKPPQPPDASGDVGYGKPPVHSRFQKGQSGNPKGRARGSCNLTTAVNRALKETVVVTENGHRKTISKLDAAIKGLVNRSVKGDARAVQQLLGLAPLVGMEPANATGGLDQTEAAIVAGLFKQFDASSNAVTKNPSSDSTDPSQENVP